MDLPGAAREKLKPVPAAALTVVLLKRGLLNVVIRGVEKINAQAPRPVGRAVAVCPGDAMVGDNDVVAIPAAMSQEVANVALVQTALEDFEDRMRAGQSISGPYAPGDGASAEFAAWRQKEGR
ncbi:hypothetical protein QA644_25905 (plasmid) [Rhizobium sp. CC1099]|uniref:hypothetical protein n=1 Tax=Rhizobium sp. CC1099 TaxID=3039160 RepID=UPI0024B200F7|nr:hypothetical protein [Rhizobium sp. CC1099]WFU91577.1 hypothetical protein QA644_25905 [Rhizobium sp. CC1099]